MDGWMDGWMQVGNGVDGRIECHHHGRCDGRLPWKLLLGIRLERPPARSSWLYYIAITNMIYFERDMEGM